VIGNLFCLHGCCFIVNPCRLHYGVKSHEHQGVEAFSLDAMQCKHAQAIILLEDNEYDEGLDKSHKACVKHKQEYAHQVFA
jgi:hypothetical protein